MAALAIPKRPWETEEGSRRKEATEPPSPVTRYVSHTPKAPPSSSTILRWTRVGPEPCTAQQHQPAMPHFPKTYIMKMLEDMWVQSAWQKVQVMNCRRQGRM